MAKNRIQFLMRKERSYYLVEFKFHSINENSFTKGGDDSDIFKMWFFYLRDLGILPNAF